MVKEMEYRKLAKKLKALGCTSRSGKGDHEVWTCPCGKHSTTVTRPGTVSPGLVRQAIQRLSCLPKGSIQ